MIKLGQLVPFIEQALQGIDTCLYLRRKRKRITTVPLAWLVAAVVWFNASGMRCWKRYVTVVLPMQLSRWRLCYSRWSFWRAELAGLVEALAERLCVKQGFRGMSLIDATALPVSAIQRERDHKCFSKYVSKGCGSLGWFYGFKLHLIVSADGELLRFRVTTGKAHDTQPLFERDFLRELRGCLIGDSGYRVRKARRAQVRSDGLTIVPRPAGFTDPQMPWSLRKLFKSRWRIESVFSELKESLGLRLTGRCKNYATFKTTAFSSLIVYTLNRRLQQA